MTDDQRSRLDAARQMWDDAASTFDDEPDHGLRDPAIRAAWTELLRLSLAGVTGTALDIGSGTGSLSLVLGHLGYDVTGIDLSPEMIARAEAKARAAGLSIDFHVMDAAFPQFPPRTYDAIICRHILWALADTKAVLERWSTLLKPGGRVVLIEGFWHTGVGLRADEIVAVLPTSLSNVRVNDLSTRIDLWGADHDDERFAVVADMRD